MDRFLSIQAFVRVAETESFAEAARQLGVANSVVTQRVKQLEEVAKMKQPDLTAADLEAAVRTIAGSARSMGVDVEGV